MSGKWLEQGKGEGALPPPPPVMADEGGPCDNNGAGLGRGAVKVVEAEGEVRKMTPGFCGVVTMSSIETSKEAPGP